VKLKFDACSLILSQKLHLLPLLHDTFGTLYITSAVNDEVIKQGNKPESAEKIKEFIDQGLIENIIPRGILLSSLGKGEGETLAETKTQKENGEDAVCVTEDKKAKKEAIRLNLDVLGLDSLLVEAVLLEKMTEDEFDDEILALDKIHKLDITRISELRRFIRIVTNKKRDE